MKKLLFLITALTLTSCHSRLLERDEQRVDPLVYVPVEQSIVNASFEDWDLYGPIGWLTQVGGKVIPNYLISPSNDALDGKYALRVDVLDTGQDLINGICWYLAFDPDQFKGKRVTIKAWVKTDMPDTWRITLKWGSGNQYGTIASGTGQWEELTAVHDIPKTASILWIRVGCLTDDVRVGTALFDKVSITAEDSVIPVVQP